MIKIDRSKPFDPVAFLGSGWTIWKGPEDQNGMVGEEEQDVRSLALTEMDLGLIEKGNIRMDAGIFWSLWQNQHLIPASWKEPIDGEIRCIPFEGTTLRDVFGGRYILVMFWVGGLLDWGIRSRPAPCRIVAGTALHLLY